jgi:hypothetical protein
MDFCSCCRSCCNFCGSCEPPRVQQQVVVQQGMPMVAAPMGQQFNPMYTTSPGAPQVVLVPLQ